MECLNIRSELRNTKKAIHNGKLRIGFLGGSITETRVPHNWTEPFIHSLTKQYKNLTVISENAAIGATGSDLGLIRVNRDIISKNCDLVFLEYSVNDYWTNSRERKDALEGIIRRLLRYGSCDIVLVHTYCQEMYARMMEGEIPDSIADFEELARYYQLNTAWVGRYALDYVQDGQMRFEEWLPDGLHPQYRGSAVYAQCVYELILNGMECSLKRPDSMKEPLSPTNWENATLLPVQDLEAKHPFYIKRCSTQSFVDYVLYTSAVNAVLSFSFVGRGCIVVFDFGTHSAEFTYQVDGGSIETSNRDRPQWCGVNGWLRPFVIGGDLCNEKHEITIKVIHGGTQEHRGTNFELAYILVLQ